MILKLLPMLLTAAMVSLMTACSGTTGDDFSQASGSSVTEQASEVAGSLGEFRTDAVLEETVLLDEDGVKITATGLTYTDYEVRVDLTLENNSGKDLSFVAGSMGYSCNSVNGYMIDDGYLNCDVAAGKKASDTISFSYDDLMFYGIDEIADLELGIYTTDPSYHSTYYKPFQLKTSAYETHDYSTDHYQNTITSGAAKHTYGYQMDQFSKEAQYDKNGVKLLSSGVMTKRDGTTVILLEVQNTADKPIYLTTSHIVINGLLVEDSTWSSDAINPGKNRIVDVQLSSVMSQEYQKAYGISEVGSVSISLGQKDEKGRELFAGTPIEITVPGGKAQFNADGAEVYNNDGLRIVSKGVVEDGLEYSSMMHVLLLVENNSGRTLSVGDKYNSLSVNGYMTDYICYTQELKDGETAIFPIDLWKSSLEKNQITSAEEIQEVEVSLEIKEGYTSVGQPKLTLSFEK